MLPLEKKLNQMTLDQLILSGQEINNRLADASLHIKRIEDMRQKLLELTDELDVMLKDEEAHINDLTAMVNEFEEAIQRQRGRISELDATERRDT